MKVFLLPFGKFCIQLCIQQRLIKQSSLKYYNRQSTIEKLPTEILAIIFDQSPNINLPLSSIYIEEKLSLNKTFQTCKAIGKCVVSSSDGNKVRSYQACQEFSRLLVEPWMSIELLEKVLKICTNDGHIGRDGIKVVPKAFRDMYGEDDSFEDDFSDFLFDCKIPLPSELFERPFTSRKVQIILLISTLDVDFYRFTTPAIADDSFRRAIIDGRDDIAVAFMDMRLINYEYLKEYLKLAVFYSLETGIIAYLLTLFIIFYQFYGAGPNQLPYDEEVDSFTAAYETPRNNIINDMYRRTTRYVEVFQTPRLDNPERRYQYLPLFAKCFLELSGDGDNKVIRWKNFVNDEGIEFQ